jgi:hypothetical protein
VEKKKILLLPFTHFTLINSCLLLLLPFTPLIYSLCSN